MFESYEAPESRFFRNNQAILDDVDIDELCIYLQSHQITLDEALSLFGKSVNKYSPNENFRILQYTDIIYENDTQKFIELARKMQRITKVKAFNFIAKGVEELCRDKEVHQEVITDLNNEIASKNELISRMRRKLEKKSSKLLQRATIINQMERDYFHLKSFLKTNVPNPTPGLAHALDPIIDFRKPCTIGKESFYRIYYHFEKISKKENMEEILAGVQNGYFDITNTLGWNIFLWAALNNNYILCQQLHVLNINPDCRSASTHCSVLHWFSKNGNLEAVKYFSFVCDINAQDIDRDTPLHIAVRMDKVQIVEYLCSLQGINVNLQNIYYERPLSLAKCDQVKQILVNSGAVI